MATDPSYRSMGLGASILGACARHVLAADGGEIWCTARVAATTFYLERGFDAVGEPFEFHGLGNHLLLVAKPDAVARAARPAGEAQAG
jgi:predicted GNAT family N-acyltransferase